MRPRLVAVALSLGAACAAAGVTVGLAGAPFAWSISLLIAALGCALVALASGFARPSAIPSNRVRRAAVLGLSAFVGPAGLMFAGCWSVGQLWIPSWVGGVLPSIAFLASLSLVPLAVIVFALALGSLVRRDRAAARDSALLGGGALLGLALMLATGPWMMALRVAGFGRLGEASAPIVAAIEAFARQHGAPPRDLGELVPAHLSALPPWSDRLRYDHERGSPRDLYGNPWIITVRAGFGSGFDSFVYFPRQNYPDYMFGGAPERVGEWVYVHE